ncbi:TolC family outer membrane protein [Novosphingobium sp. 1949]|uniref:TolC family outer membrane protein n=1 Tax=Novosphingobium organovorum TaxID=2930092 RepID=A0ABT0BE60_9SPHN|nr:TolC family outer membrane protein [Novosphingobium organovorum]MCJ2183294.1 TolC family outer membrane protein [Novosphingobium organovorum]
MARLSYPTATCALALLLTAGAGKAETLQDALAAAYEGNPQLQGDRELVVAADERVVQAKAAYGPSLSLSATHQFTAARIRGGVLPSHDDGFGSTVELSLSQPLFTSGRLSSTIDAADAARQAARESLRAKEQQLLLDVADAYITLRRDIALYAITVENYDILLQQSSVTAARFRLRDSTEPDIDQTSNRLELAAGRVIAARATVEISAARYRRLVGHYPDELAAPPTLPAPSTLETLYVDAERHNPSLAAAQFTEQASRANVRVERAQMRPQVNGFSTLYRAPVTDYQNSWREEGVVAGVNLTMQLYSGGRQSASLREAIARNLADQHYVEEARRTMRETLASDWSLLGSARQALPRYAAAVRAAESAVDGVKRQETSGIRTLRDVLDVTNDLLSARIAAAQAEAEIGLRQLALMRDAGTLSIETLTARGPYDPDQRTSTLAAFAGMPLRLVLEPVDRLLQPAAHRKATIQSETPGDYGWSRDLADPLQPITPAPTSSPASGAPPR